MANPLPDSFGIANNCDPATVDYFVKIFGYAEALELSNIDNPTSNRIDNEKIQIALNDASILINNFINTASPQGKLLIAGSYRRTQATLARCYLDTLRPRQHVLDACEKALQQLDLWASKSQPSSALKYQEARRYWGSCSGFVKSSYARGRSFTESSLFQWQNLFGTNNRRNAMPNIEANVPIRELKSNSQQPDCPPMQTDPVMNVVNALEEARGLGNFADTHEAIEPDEPTIIVANSTPEFQAPLLEGEEY